VTDVLAADRIVLGGTARTRDDAVREVGHVLVDAGAVRPAYVDGMLEREETAPTYMGNFLAIPHGTLGAKEQIVRTAVALVRYDEPVDWGGQPVRVVVGIAGAGDEHLEVLGPIALVFSDEDKVARVLEADDAVAVLAAFEIVDGS